MIALLLGIYNSNIGIDTKNKCTILSITTLICSYSNKPVPYTSKLLASSIVNIGMYYLGTMFKPKGNTYR